MPKTDAERQRKRREKLAAEEGTLIHVALERPAATKLAAWVATGETVTSVVNRLLSKSRPPKRP